MENENTIEVSIKAYGIKHSFEIDDGSTWMATMEEFIKLLNATGYQVDINKIQEWLEFEEINI